MSVDPKVQNRKFFYSGVRFIHYCGQLLLLYCRMSSTDLCAEFCSLTGTDTDEAMNWLEMAGFELQDAVGLYFNATGEEVANQQGNLSRSSKESREEHFVDEDDFVRKPDEVKRQKLMDTGAYIGEKGITFVKFESIKLYFTYVLL